MSYRVPESGTSLPGKDGPEEFSGPGPIPPVIRTRDNIRFINVPAGYRQIYEVPEYRFSDIRNDDIVIDIGANVGAFCIRAAYYSASVYAVEPITYEILRKNIRLNRVSVTVFDCALGSGDVEGICGGAGLQGFEDAASSDRIAFERSREGRVLCAFLHLLLPCGCVVPVDGRAGCRWEHQHQRGE